jgi:glucose-1-phosphatase
MKLLKDRKILKPNIKNIIFDWGGVITNIDHQATIDKFAEIGMPGFKEYYSQSAANKLFRQFEKGMISAEEMRKNLRKDYQANVSNEEIDNAWCAMLLDTPAERLEILKSLKKNYRLFLLSNTNIIHVEYYNKIIYEKFNLHFSDIFDYIFYSHEIGMRKPDTEVFEYVLKFSQLDSKETLFADDLEINISAAKQAGINTFHVKTPNAILELKK